jgi:predicted nuclease of restriction endonuclease-like RecB superfamily
MDRMSFEEPRPEVAEQRRSHFAIAASVLRALPATASIVDYELRLQELLPAPLEAVREGLYADLPGQRPLLEWRKLTPRGLLERYNLALAQGLVLYSRKLVVHAIQPELLRVRRLLRWLKFCRLVAELLHEGEDWTLEVEGPAAIFSMQKKDGLQLAQFLAAVPLLQRWRLEAEIQMPRRGSYRLELSHKDALVPLHDAALGHVPPEIRQVAEKFSSGPWELDLTPSPRPVGAKDLCVPDLGFRHRGSGVEVAFELFHRWHRSALERRLEGLRSRPDPHLFLGVDRLLMKQPALRGALEDCPQVMPFNVFPSEKKIREILASFPETRPKKRAKVRKSGPKPGEEDKDFESPRPGRKGPSHRRSDSDVSGGRGRRSPGSDSGTAGSGRRRADA